MSIDFTKISHVLFFAGLLPLLSLALAWIFSKVIPDPPFWLDTVSPVFAYVLFYSLFEKYFWRWKAFKVFGIVVFPDLHGRWKGKQQSSHTEGEYSVRVSSYLEISQTFSKVFVQAYYERSCSESVIADFTNLNNEIYLFYTYDNEPSSLKTGTMQVHKGTVKLKYLSSDNKLVGTYFNSIGNRGELDFEFEQYDLLKRFAR